MTLEEITAKGEADCIIDKTEISNEILKISELTFQWQRLLMEENLKATKAKQDYNKIYLEKYILYTQGAKSTKDKDLIKKLPSGAILKAEAEMYLQADDDIISASTKISTTAEKVKFIEAILWELRSRGRNLQNYVQWEKFLAGI